MRPDYNTYSDQELLKALAGNDQPLSKEAFRIITGRYSDQMLMTCYPILQNNDAAKDCVQNVLLRIWQNRHLYHIDNLPAYLHRAVRMECLQALRNTKHVESLDERFASIKTRLRACDPLRYKELMALMNKVLSALPEDDRKIFLLSREQDMTYKEIADKLGISVKTVEKKMTNSLRHLRTHLNPNDSLGLITAFALFL
jgi:RNA polymerase sigma-70 factor (family 1)